MAVTPSTMLELGTRAPEFKLLEPATGAEVSSEDFNGAKAFLVAFWCNHCPYVRHIQHQFSDFVKEYQEKGLAVVGINSNDVESHPVDHPDRMVRQVEEIGYTFPYLYDETQEVARAYRAACTPDLFLFDDERKLVYRGQFDGSRPGNPVPVTGEDLRKAVDEVLAGEPVTGKQQASMGCNIKWKLGSEPEYFG